ncbi:hypothetical protein CEXT_151531 [Caerostris extrusa]|uniref:Uncharacterized protein n=1 Tax=Caerostris extrusa TaxID=172846 RepID=A0AAV4V795_CAEEX|nr:hypothetical protein CEXT_151531 [Caerostris extrusa]
MKPLNGPRNRPTELTQRLMRHRFAVYWTESSRLSTNNFCDRNPLGTGGDFTVGPGPPKCATKPACNESYGVNPKSIKDEWHLNP